MESQKSPWVDIISFLSGISIFIKILRIKPESREYFSVAYFNRKMLIFGGRKGEKRLNDLNIWHISVPRASFKDCTLRNEIVLKFFAFFI